MHFDYYSGWKAQEFACSECQWEGRGSSLALEPFEALAELHCPGCDSKFGIVSYPTLEETKQAAALGNPEAQAELRRFDSR